MCARQSCGIGAFWSANRRAAARLHLERLPGYAPDLNPAEGVWHQLKHVELGNVCCRDLAHIRQELSAATERLRQRPEVIKACLQQAGCL